MSEEKSKRQSVLIIDPQPNMAMLVAGMFRTLGHREIREVNDGRQAQLELSRRPYDVIVIDDSITGMDAVDLVRVLRATPDSPNRMTPIIMMAASPGMARISAARDAGVTEFLRKPFAANHLQTRLDNIAANPRAFIEGGSYAGPDRRRRRVDVGEDRRGAPNEAV